MSCKNYQCYQRDCSGACGTSQTARQMMNEEEYKKYSKEKENTLEEYFNLAIKSSITEDLLDMEVLEEIINFSTSEQAWKKINELKDLIKLLIQNNN
jgi:hypothetical protein